MRTLSVHFIDSLLVRLERITVRSIKLKCFSRSIRLLKTISFIRYKFYLGYKNDFVEAKIRHLAQHIAKVPFVENNNKKSIVIIDEINADYVGLMTQYLAPFISSDYQILYIYEQIEHKGDVRTHLMQSLKSYENAQLREIPSINNLFKKSQWIYNEVCAFGSEKVLMNFGEWAVEKCVACYALPEKCIKYHINACDHTFWAGACCADYSFEFRHYGANLSYHERGLRREQVVYLPFYPVLKDVSFAGLPKECEGKTIFLSGGATYKVVDEEKTFFRLCKRILNECPNAIILYAGANSSNGDKDVLSSGIEQFGLQGRFISIGYRNDILEVFRHSDVFLNTYPIGGGVMCQFAAHCSLPIVNYKIASAEECVSQKAECHFTYTTGEDFVKEAVRLYANVDYRKRKGVALHDTVISKEEFENALLTFISTGKPLYEVKWSKVFVPRSLNTDDSIKYNNSVLFFFYYQLYHLLGIDSFRIMPGNYISFSIFRVKRKLKKVFS